MESRDFINVVDIAGGVIASLDNDGRMAKQLI